MKYESTKKWEYDIKIDREKEKRFKRFCKDYQFDLYCSYSRPHSLKKLLYGDRSYNAGTKYDTIDADVSGVLDHAKVFKQRGTDQVMLISQPYQYNLDEVRRFADNLQLEVVIWGTDKSWYYPGSTHVLLFMSPKTYQHYRGLLE